GPTMLRPSRDVAPGQTQRPPIDDERSSRRVEKRRFPRAVRADDDNERTRLDRQIDALQRPYLVGGAGVKRLANTDGFEHSLISTVLAGGSAGRAAPGPETRRPR